MQTHPEPHDDAETRLDKVAITISVVCLAHCLALPVAIVAAPALGSVVLGTESPVHWVLLALALPVSARALWLGYRHHQQWHTLALGALGLGFMGAGVTHVISAELEMPLTVAGVLGLLAAHVLNLRHSLHCHGAHAPAEQG
jgi:hypothetical protein